MTTKSSRLTPEFESELRKLCSLEMKTALAEIAALRAEREAIYKSNMELVRHLNAEIDALRVDLAAITQLKDNYENGYNQYKERCFREANRVIELREALAAAQDLINEFHSYSTGASCMAEEDVAELFGKYSELSDGLIAQAAKESSDGM